MNNCDACNCEIGYIYTLIGPSSCAFCSTPIILSDGDNLGQYRGMVGDTHVFRLLHSVRCPECRERLFQSNVHCSNDSYGDEFTQEVYKLFGIPAKSYS